MNSIRYHRGVFLWGAVSLVALGTGAWADDHGTQADDTGQCAPASAVSGAYKGVHYANDFSYLDAPCITPDDPRGAVEQFTDRLKLIDLGPGLRLSVGGEGRVRYHNEEGIGLSRLSGLDEEFVLSRVRAHADVRIGDYLRAYVEVVDARKSGGNLPARNIESAHGDLLNGFVEVGVPVAHGKASFRAGRQELIFGAQRLISPLDWGNTRRSFDGFSAHYQNTDFTVDAWFANPRAIAQSDSFRDRSTEFSGIYGQWRGLAGHTVDLYVLNLDRDIPGVPETGFATVGSRVKGGYVRFNWEAEGAFQTGHTGNANMRAWMLSANMGANLSSWLPGSPSFSLAYDFASGDGDRDDGTVRTFNQLFPLAHAWLGMMDLVGRQNIEAFSARLVAKPLPRIGTSLTVHDFSLAKARDALYNAGGAAIRHDPTGIAGKSVGRELDIVIDYNPARWYNLQLGYGHFWAGKFVERTGEEGISGNADFFYLQTIVRF